jgi:uncharacterized membrane protein YfcA
MELTDAALLAAGGLIAGVVNTLAGGGTLLTVPLLTLLGLPSLVANGTNRVGILLQNGVATWRFAALGVTGLREAAPLLLPTAVGAAIGAYGVNQLPGAVFDRVFGVIMLLLLVPTLRAGAPAARAGAAQRKPLRPGLRSLLFFAIGAYGGAFQAGVGVLLISALSLTGHDLVRSNHIKTALNTCFTLVALPLFLLAGTVSWPHALALGAGFAGGGALGARVAVRGGARVIRPVLAVAVVALAGRMLGLY